SLVRPLIINAFQELRIDVHLYEPAGAPPLDQMIERTKRPKMTMGRAGMIGAMGNYAGLGYRMSGIEVHKMSYFRHQVGALATLHFEKHLDGPYAEKLNLVLQAMEGQFIRRYGDRTSGSEIRLLKDAKEEAQPLLDEHSEAKHYL